jgi:hypothetical protein
MILGWPIALRRNVTRPRSNASLAAAVLVAGSLPVIALAAAQSLRTLPAQQDIWITGTIQRGNGQYAPGAYATILLDRPSTSPLR